MTFSGCQAGLIEGGATTPLRCDTGCDFTEVSDFSEFLQAVSHRQVYMQKNYYDFLMERSYYLQYT